MGRSISHVCFLLLLAFAGCHAADPVPTYAPRSAADSLGLMRQRAADVHDVSGQGDLTLTDAAGQSVVLEAAFVLAPPDRARVRAWKFGQAVLDLTVRPDGAWLYQGRRTGGGENLKTASADARRAIAAWLPLLSDRIDADAKSTHSTPSELVVIRPAESGGFIVCTIDRPTLTPRQYCVTDAGGAVRFTLDLAAYRTAGPTVWPTRITATSPGGTMTIELRDVEVDVAAPAAFDPPARAEKLP